MVSLDAQTHAQLNVFACTAVTKSKLKRLLWPRGFGRHPPHTITIEPCVTAPQTACVQCNIQSLIQDNPLCTVAGVFCTHDYVVGVTAILGSGTASGIYASFWVRRG
jgi:hypothetical protein